MRTLNVRLAAVLVVLVLLLGVGTYFLHGYQMLRNADVFKHEADKFLEQAAEAEKNKDKAAAGEANGEAIKNLRWFVRLKPKETDSMERLGMLLADRASGVRDSRLFAEAYGTLESLLRLEPERGQARRRVIDMAMANGLYRDAKEHLRDFLLPQTPKEKQAELWDLLGQCNTQTDDFDAAIENYKQAIELSPTNTDSYARLAAILRQRSGRSREADQLMDQLVKVNPNSYRAHFLRGAYLKNIGAEDEALTEALTALQLAPNEREVLLLAVSCYVARQDFAKAREYAAQAVKLFPSDVDVFIAMSQVEFAAGDRAKALEALQQGLKATARDPQLLWRLATLLIDANQLKDAQKVVAELRDTRWEKPLIDYLAARIEFVQERWLAARESLERIRASLGAWPAVQAQADVAIGQCYGQAGNRDRQVAAFRRALIIDGGNMPAIAGLVDALMAQGKIDEALGEYNKLEKTGKLTPAMLIPKVQMLILQNLKKPAAEQQWSDAEKMLDTIAKLDPNVVQVPVLRAQILDMQDRAAEAEEVLKKAIAKNPKNNLLRAELTKRSKDPAKIQEMLKDWQETSGDTVEQRLAQAQSVVRLEGETAADALRKLAGNAEHFTDDERVRLWSGLVGAAMQGGDLPLARKLCKQIAEKEPQSIQIRYLMFDYAMYANDEAGMEEALKEVERVAGQDPFWLCGQAILLTMQAKDAKDSEAMLTQAMKKLTQARQVRPTWSRLPVVMAGIYDRQGNADLALKEYLEAMEMGEQSPGPVRRTIQLLFIKQRYADADRLLRNLAKQQVPFTQEMNRAAAETALQMRDFERALAMARKVTTEESKNYQEHVWQGEVLNIISRHEKDQGREKEADELLAESEKSLRRAVELEPTKPATWIALIRFLTALDRETEAEKAVGEAGTKIAPNERPLGLAQCYEAMKRNETAQDHYERALAAAPDDPVTVRTVADFYYRNGNTKSAETLLSRMTGGEVASPAADVAWARRVLASILAQRGGYKNLEAARELLNKNLASAERATLDVRAKANMDASAPQRARRDEATRVFEGMVRDQIATGEDRFTLAQLYLKSSAPERALAQLRSLTVAYPTEGKYLATYISALLENDQISSAVEQLDRLDKLYPNHLTAVSLRAEALAARNEAPRGFELLKSFIDRPNALPADRSIRVYSIAQKLEGLAKRLSKQAQSTLSELFLQEAETLYRDYVDQNSGTEWVMVAYLARQGRIDEGLDLLDRTWDSQSPPVLAQVASLFMRDGVASGERLLRLSQIVQKAISQFERPVPLLIIMADLYARQGRYSDAESTYREVLKKNPGNIQAMNNLAVLFALQGVKLDEALQLINHAIEIAGPLGAILDSRAIIYLAQGDLEKAQADLNNALADDETPLRLFHQAQVFDRGGQQLKVAATMKKAIEKGLTKQMLQPEEVASFEKLSQSVKSK